MNDSNKVDALEFLEESGRPAPDFRLFTVAQITGGTFVGSPLAGAYMMACNFRRLGDRAKFLPTMALGIFSTVVIMTLAFFLPDNFPNAILPAAYTGAIASLARYFQGKEIENHLRIGGKKSGFGITAGVSVLCLVVVVAAFFGAVMAIPEDKVVFGPEEEVYFEQGATEADARTLGKYLQENGFFTGENAISVYLKREEKTVVISFVVLEGVWNDAEMVAAYQELTDGISSARFFESIKVQLIDEWTIPKKTLFPRQP